MGLQPTHERNGFEFHVRRIVDALAYEMRDPRATLITHGRCQVTDKAEHMRVSHEPFTGITRRTCSKSTEPTILASADPVSMPTLRWSAAAHG